LKFKKTHSLALGDVCGEAKAVTSKTGADWAPKLLLPVEGHELKDAANDNKTGLFFHVLCSKTMSLRVKKWKRNTHTKKKSISAC
jgi:hypothetical protein